MGRLRRPGNGSGGEFVSVSCKAPEIDGLGRQLIDDALRSGVIEAATEAAAEQQLGDEWSVGVTMNVDDGRTIKATVAKAADGEPEITAWDPNASRDDDAADDDNA